MTAKLCMRNPNKISLDDNECKGTILARLRDRRKENICMRLTEIRWEGGLHLVLLTRDREKQRALVNTVMNLRVPNNDAGNSLTALDTTSLSRHSFSTESR
jgi:hypothetical protein